MFTFALIIRTVYSKSKSVIGACTVNVIFIAMMLAVIDKADLWFIFC